MKFLKLEYGTHKSHIEISEATNLESVDCDALFRSCLNPALDSTLSDQFTDGAKLFQTVEQGRGSSDLVAFLAP